MADNYIVSARKYRPDTFSSIVGQGAMSSTLRAAVLQERLAHAYLFCGPRGVGKTTAARVLAKTINCMSLTPEGEACGACESCMAFAEQRSFNIFELDAASNNSVEDIRALTEQVAIAPALGRYKVYIIDEVHMLSQAAFNAFLKTLEEPPAYAIFILATTEKHKILPTILSRCQIYDFKRITVMDIVRHLRYVADSEGITAEDSALGLVAEKADGGMRDALSMFDRIASYGQGVITYQTALECLNVLDYSYHIRMIDAFTTGDYRGILLLVDELLGKGFDGQLIMAGLASFARDLLVVQHPSTLPLLEKPDTVLQLYADTARRISASALHQMVRALVTADTQYRGATNKRLLVELTLLSILSQIQPNALSQQAAVPTSQISVQPAPTPQEQSSHPSHTAVAPTPQTTSMPSHQATQPSYQSAPPTSQQASIGTQAQLPSTQPITHHAQPTTTGTTEATQGPSHPASATTAPPVQGGLARSRQAFRNRSAHLAQTKSIATPTEESVPEGHEPFDEVMLQQEWMQFFKHELDDEHHLIVKRTLTLQLPKLIGPTHAEIAIANSSAIVELVEQVLPQAIRYIQRKLRNTDLNISIRLKTAEESWVPVTSEDRFKVLNEQNPNVGRLRQQLRLRLR